MSSCLTMDHIGQAGSNGGRTLQRRKKIPPGNAVQVISLSSDVKGRKSSSARGLKLDTQVLRDILSKAENLPLTIVAIAGPARKGKSFLLSYVVRYLQALEKSDDGEAGDWMNKANPNLRMDGKGFEFRSGMDRTTDGIWMWTRPFIIKRSETESPIAVLVMDTEGCFDPYSNEQEQSSIVGISLLLSSCFIYNDSGLINENTLITLAKFMQYGKIALQSFEGKMFQRLMFLVRDWCTGGFEHGAAGGQNFIRRQIQANSKMTEQARETRQLITDNWEDYNAYLMPFPGDDVISDDFGGSVAEMGNEFCKHIEKFIVNLVADFSVKTFAAEPAAGRSFFKIFCKLVDAFNAEDMPSPSSILDVTIMTAFETRVHNVVCDYETEFKEKLATKAQQFYNEDLLKKYHQKFQKTSLRKFSDMKHLGANELKDSFHQKLLYQIEKVFGRIIDENVEKQKKFVKESSQKVLENFQTSMNFFCGKIYSVDEYERLAAEKEQNAILSLSASATVPKTQLVEDEKHTLVREMLEIKCRCLNEMNLQRQKFEQELNSRSHDILSQYRSRMEVVLSGDDVLSQRRLQNAHDAQVQRLMLNFTGAEALEEEVIRDISFIEKWKSHLAQHLQQSFSDFRTKNENKLREIVAQVQQDIADACEVFKEEVQNELQSVDKPDLEKIFNEILEMGKSTLEERGIPDPAMLDSFLERLNREMQEALVNMRELVLQRIRSKEQKCETALREAVSRIQKKREQFLASDELLELSKLKQQFDACVKEARADLSHKISDTRLSEGRRFIDQFEKSVMKVGPELLQLNNKKIDDFHTQVKRLRETLVVAYNEKMQKQELNWTTSDDLDRFHQGVVDDLVKRLKTESPFNKYPKQLSNFQQPFEQDLQTAYKKYRTTLDSRCNQSRKIREEIIPDALNQSRKKLQLYIENHPFMSEIILSNIFEAEFNNLLATIQNRVAQSFPVDSQLGKLVLDRFRKEASQLQSDLMDISSSVRKLVEAKVDTILTECLQHAEDHPVFEAMSRDFAGTSPRAQEDMRDDVKKFFDQSWQIIPNANDEKEKVWKKILDKMTSKFQSVYNKLLLKSREENETVEIVTGSILSNFCTEASNFLQLFKFYPSDVLEEIIENERTRSIAEFQTKLEESNIEVTNKKLQAVLSRLDKKVDELKDENVQNMQVVAAEAKEIATLFYQTRLESICSQSDLDKVQEEADQDALKYVCDKCYGSIEDNQDHFQIFQENSRLAYNEILSALEVSLSDPAVVEQILIDAVTMYDSAMDKQLEGRRPVNPENLVQFDEFCKVSTFKRIGKTHFINHKLKDQILERLLFSYKIFEDRNNLEHAQRNNTAIGIDLGTTTSCVAIYQTGKAEVIKDASGRSLTPSYVHFDENGTTIVGHEAKTASEADPENTIFDAKRLIGREYQDPYVQEDKENWPFEVVGDTNGKPKIVIRGEEFGPEAISAHVLRHMRNIAVRHLNRDVKKAVITVPANFSDKQRDATRQAAQIAGLDVLQIINEPTAAAMAYALNWKDEEKTVLVFDFGGGTFDVTILKTEIQPSSQNSSSTDEGEAELPAEVNQETGCRLKVLNTAGHTHLGGEDFDSRMVKYCVDDFLAKHTIHLLEDRDGNLTNKAMRNRRLRRLRAACEIAKANLSTARTVNIRVDEVGHGLDLDVNLTRQQFEDMNKDLFQQAIDIVRKAITDAKVDKKNITEVLMVGGSCRIPRVKAMLQEFLGVPALNLNQVVDIQEAVAMGAAVQACILTGGSTVGNLPVIKDIQPFSLGITTVTGKMVVIIPRNTTIPHQAGQSFRTAFDNQKRVRIDISAGEEFLAANNVLLGSFTLSGIPPGPAGSQTIDVKMNIDISGILNVTATSTSIGHSQNLTIEECRGRYTEDEISEMRNRLRLFRVDAEDN